MIRALVVSVAVLSGSAYAAAPAEQAGEDEARRDFDLGRERFGARDFAAAADAFVKAYDLSHRKELLFNIGVCRRELGQMELALDAFRQYLAFAGPSAANADQVRQQIADLERLVPAHLEVHSRGKPGTVSVDGTARGRTPLELVLASGPHTLVAEGPWPTERRELQLGAGERKILEVGKKSRTGLWIGIGVGAAVVVGAVVTAVVLTTRPAETHTGTLQPGTFTFC